MLLPDLLLIIYPVCFLIPSRNTCPGRALCKLGWAFLYQSVIKETLHRLAYSPAIWRHFLNCDSFFQNDYCLCQVDKTLSNTYAMCGQLPRENRRWVRTCEPRVTGNCEPPNTNSENNFMSSGRAGSAHNSEFSLQSQFLNILIILLLYFCGSEWVSVDGHATGVIPDTHFCVFLVLAHLSHQTI